MASRVSDIHKSAVWIYGVAGMVMREPIAVLFRHAAASGFGDAVVQQELARVLVVLAALTRVLLAASLSFEQVYIRPDAALRFPRCSFALDFIAVMLQVVGFVAASAALGAAPGFFDATLVAGLLFGVVWWAASAALGYSTARPLAIAARQGMIQCAAFAAIWGAGYWGGLGEPRAEGLACLLLLGMLVREMASLVRAYDAPSGGAL